MDLVSEFGDPRVLLLAEDHIVLKLETPWPPDQVLPEGLSLVDDAGVFLVVNQKSLICAFERGSLQGTRISKALFCGCESFHSWDRYANAASALLREAEEICILHNKDKVYKLIRLFPCVKVLALPHDGCVHQLELDEPCRDRSAPLVKKSELRELVGNASHMGEGGLAITPDTTLALIRACPHVRRIDSHWVLACLMSPLGSMTSTQRRMSESFTHLWLPCLDGGSSGGPDKEDELDATLIAKRFSSVTNLNVGVESPEAFAKVSAFCNLRSLLVEIRPDRAIANLNPQLCGVLAASPGLVELTLGRFAGLSLFAITRLCPRLKKLKLERCLVADCDIPAGAFSHLEYVDIDVDIITSAFMEFMRATRDTLRVARFGSDGLCLAFLQLSVLNPVFQPFPHLEHLTLNTNLSLKCLRVTPTQVNDMIKALPVLCHLETNSYDLRLLIENYWVPRGRVSLSWVGCVYCAVSNPGHAWCEKMLAFIKDHRASMV
ncbi:hypothetical protein HPB50_010217 [Hyalomma asiaticum]|uniref:Uncharacterized protein n=1 Tax=Hyalomma asiaticum TaxID=266040 RepID=A0ACB7RP72_HYAAI|nr:hypothetical protein HPB50_010217 [Hyalomma asiaticum]